MERLKRAAGINRWSLTTLVLTAALHVADQINSSVQENVEPASPKTVLDRKPEPEKYTLASWGSRTPIRENQQLVGTSKLSGLTRAQRAEAEEHGYYTDEDGDRVMI